ncbi:MAG: molybdopterin cofactor-binding domain-containing protein [Sphingomicrobium sp.]
MKVDRRTLLVGGGTGVGLIVAFALWPRRLGSDLAAGRGEHTFGNFIKVARDGRVTVAISQAETGQGAWTALPQIVADELGAAWETVAVEPAPAAKAYANPLAREEGWPDAIRITAAATSVRAFEQPLRRASATAREMLIGAAADRWNVSPADCETADGFVINGVRTFGFGELAEEASSRAAPLKPTLRPKAKSRLLGQPLQRLDGPGKSDGSLRFASDVRLPGMLFAAVRIAPPNGRLRSFGRGALAAFPGVRHVTARDGWIAVAADDWWSAEQALKAADPQFTGTRGAADLRPLFETAVAHGDGEPWFSRGDYDRATRGSRALAATYYVAPAQHLGLEPLSATARVSGGAAEIWAGSQASGLLDKARLYPMPIGEPAGRAIEADAAPYATELARILGRPVQVTLSNAHGQTHDRLSAGALGRMTALPGDGGITDAWAMRVATADGLSSALARLAGRASPKKLGGGALDGAVPPYAIPNVRIEAVRTALPFEPGYMRGSPQRELSFFTESFMDELAHAAGLEPLSLRMALLGQNGRLARCLQAATRRAQWDGGGRGSIMGIAGASAFGSHIGLVATASIGGDQRIKVERLVAAVDCGRVINRGLATQQIETGLIWALAQATVPPPEWVAGMPRARPFGRLGLPRIGDTPEIVVEIIPSSAASGGLNGLSTVVLAPAVANAIYAGSGKRLRSLPFDPMAAP